MSRTVNLRIALVSGMASPSSESLTAQLLAQTDSLTVLETADEVLALPTDAQPEMIFVCCEAGFEDCLVPLRRLRSTSRSTPLVLIAPESLATLRGALAVGALALLQPPVSGAEFQSAFQRCSELVRAARRQEIDQHRDRKAAQLFTESPCCQLLIGCDGKVAILNRAASGTFGIERDCELEFSEFSGRFFAPCGSHNPEQLESALRSGFAWRGVLSGRSAKGTTPSYRVSCQPLDTHQESPGMLLTLQELTQEYAVQGKLRIALQAARDYLGLLPDSQTSAELLVLSNPNFVPPLKLDTFSLPALLDTTLAAADPGTQVRPSIPAYLPTLFRGDSGRLGQALEAVLRGSAAYGSGAPTISVCLKQRKTAAMTIQIDVAVENTSSSGNSFQGAADYLGCVAQEPGAAAGLGLAALLVEQMGGVLLVRTVQGRGRTVSCSIPLLLAAEGSSPTLPVAAVRDEPSGVTSQPALPLKVLVAEDNPIEQATLRSLLEGIGCRAVLVDNGKQAVEEFDGGDYDVVLMDILMPEMDGFEATRLIREKEQLTGGHTPVLALTSYSLKAIKQKCDSVGMNGYLAKPVVKQLLVQALLACQSDTQGTCGTEAEPEAGTPTGTGGWLEKFAVVDARQVLENLEYDTDTYRLMVEAYLDEFAGQGTELAERLSEGDLEDILACAHSLKGMTANLGGLRVAEIARKIQDLCLEGQRPDAACWAPMLEVESVSLEKALQGLDWEDLEALASRLT
jgi:CheY-like chemotaxis protein/HPt (histidine-containing phosphotransfer) domain-containing protein